MLLRGLLYTYCDILSFFEKTKKTKSTSKSKYMEYEFSGHAYSGTPPYDHPVNTTTPLLRPPRYYDHFLSVTNASVTNSRASWVVGTSRGSWVWVYKSWVWVQVVGG